VLYHLLTPFAREFPLFNLMNYISFRAAGAAVTAVVLAFVAGPGIVRFLRAKGVGQVIRAEGPASHQAKRGTPTMGGLLILLCTVVPTLLWVPIDNRYVLLALISTLCMGAIGFWDDYLKIVQGKSRGLVARHKLVGQVAFGIALAGYLLWRPLTDALPASATTVPFFKYVIVVFAPLAYVAFVTFVLTGTSNAVNVTDGLDGLAIGLSIIAAGTFAVFAYLFGRVDASGYLLVFYLRGAGELTVFLAALMGAGIGFLWFNAYPAQVFMGDTGSLALGGAFGTVAILLKAEFLLVMIGGVFVAEALSVIVQTSTFRWNRRRHGRAYAEQHRVFRMAPLHHHFEKVGWAESKIVTRFYIVGLLCALVALSSLKIR
jgi:phospho-N-acetylmuramoyl-pentapeptide-transferase